MRVTLTEQGQLTLPKSIREQLHLHPGDEVAFLLDDTGKVELVPVTSSITELKGLLPLPEKVVSLEEMEAAIHRRAGKE